jgi:hypothetical protein
VNARHANGVELLVAASTVVISTLGVLIGVYALALIGLVVGGVSVGILLGATRPPD